MAPQFQLTYMVVASIPPEGWKPPAATTFSDLPAFVLHIIAEKFSTGNDESNSQEPTGTEGVTTLLSLCLTSKAWKDEAQPVLFRNVVIMRDSSAHPLSRTSRLPLLLRTLSLSPHLRQHIRLVSSMIPVGFNLTTGPPRPDDSVTETNTKRAVRAALLENWVKILRGLRIETIDNGAASGRVMDPIKDLLIACEPDPIMGPMRAFHIWDDWSFNLADALNKYLFPALLHFCTNLQVLRLRIDSPIEDSRSLAMMMETYHQAGHNGIAFPTAVLDFQQDERTPEAASGDPEALAEAQASIMQSLVSFQSVMQIRITGISALEQGAFSVDGGRNVDVVFDNMDESDEDDDSDGWSDWREEDLDSADMFDWETQEEGSEDGDVEMDT